MTITDPIRAALKRLLMTAKLLQQNAEGCAYNHYGRDCELNDLPGWLRDTKADIDAAQQALATPPAPSAEMRERIKAVLIKVRDELIPIMDDMSEEEITEALVDAILSSGLVAPARGDWLPIAAAPRDRTPILVKFHDDIYPRICSNRDDLGRWNGLQVVMHHSGLAEDGLDIGWSVSAPVGHGGFPDKWIEGWKPLHSAAKESDGGV